MTAPKAVTVPNEDVYGNVHGTRQTTTSRWVAEGPAQPITTAPEGTDNVLAWNCPCGAIVQVREPATERVSCTFHAAEGSVCRVRGYQLALPTARPRHNVGACPCCGRQGTHEVRLDRQGILPRCLTK